jgi:imidazolonepropionase-like amidohydrolase
MGPATKGAAGSPSHLSISEGDMSLKINGSLLLLALLSAGAVAQAKDIVITNARIEVGNGTVIPSGFVLIREGKIALVGENFTSNPNADVIDAKGKTLYPGFIDAYSTRGLKLPDAPASGTAPDSRTTASATMWHGNRKGIRADIVASKCLDLKDQLDPNYQQGILTALLSSGSGTIRGIASIVTYTDAGDVLVPSEAAEIAIRGGGFGGGGGGAGGDTGYPGSLLGVISLARQTLVDALDYAGGTPAKKDDAMENLKPLMLKQIPALLTADTDREIVRCSRIADEFGFKPIFCMAHDAYKEIAMLKARGAAVFASIDPGAEPPLTNMEGSDIPTEVLAERHGLWVERSLNIKKLIDAGIPVGFSSSAGNLPDFLKNVRKTIATGVDKETALKCMTSGIAAILGISDRVGTVEAGKQANLVLMSGDIADNSSVVETVLVEGKKIDVKKGSAK